MKKLHRNESSSARPFTSRISEQAPWSYCESVSLIVLTILAAATRFVRLGHPAALVYDERIVFMQAGAYLRGWPFFLSLHPPLAKLLIAYSVDLFGDHSYARRIPSALIGTALVPVNYFLVRRMFLSRLAAALAGVLTLCEGMFLVASRMGMINIFYVTFTAIAYLALFSFRQTTDRLARRRLILVIGIALGCGFATKAGISAVAAALIVGCLLVTIWNERISGDNWEFACTAGGLLAMIGGISIGIYVIVFLPYYHYGWWTSISDLVRYHRWVIENNRALPATAIDSSPIWSWPLMLRAFPYWQSGWDPNGRAVTVWCGGNPMIWWTLPPALVVSVARAMRERSMSWTFAPLAYGSYLIMWLPVRRFLMIYDYMPMCEIGIVAVAGVLTESWKGEAQAWEQSLFLAPASAVLIYALHRGAGVAAAGGTIAVWFILIGLKNNSAGRFVCVVVILLMVVTFAYFYPLWSAMPLSHNEYLERMWFRGPGLPNWT